MREISSLIFSKERGRSKGEKKNLVKMSSEEVSPLFLGM
jgi:hypothetical protein